MDSKRSFVHRDYVESIIPDYTGVRLGRFQCILSHFRLYQWSNIVVAAVTDPQECCPWERQ